MKVIRRSILIGVALIPVFPSNAATFESTGTGFWHQQTTWNLVEGTDEGADGIPSAGDKAVIKSGNLIEMHEPHNASEVIVQGTLRGSTNAAVFNLTHNLGSVTVETGGIFELADGREAEDVTINISGDLTLREGALIKAGAFGNASNITLNLEGDYIDEVISGFALYGGAATTWTFNFIGTEPSILSMTTGASRDFGNINIESGKVLDVNSTQPIYITAGNTVTVKQLASLDLVNGAFFSGPGNFTLETGSTIAVAAGHGILRSALFQNSGTTTLPESANYVFNGIEGQDIGADLPPTVNSLRIDTPDWVTMDKNINVSGELYLTNGRLETGTYTIFAGENESQIVRVNGYVDGNLARSFNAADTGDRLFPVGKGPRYIPVNVNITTAGNGFGFLTVSAVDGPFSPAPADPALPFFWNITGSAFTGYQAQLSFTYPQGDAPTPETSLRMSRYDGNHQILPGQTVDTSLNTITVPGVTAFSQWIPVVSSSNVSSWMLY